MHYIRIILETVLTVYAVLMTYLVITCKSDLTLLHLETKTKQRSWTPSDWGNLIFK